MQRISTLIKNFEHYWFVACMIKKFGDQCDLKHALKINKNGIHNYQFIQFCTLELVRFKNSHSYSTQALEQNYLIKFCRIRLRDNRVHFLDQPEWGKNVIYIEEQQQ
jgi:hypothetical protein